MRPDRTNYEIWLIDYLDGNLGSGRTELLLNFLEENPDIREELDDLISYKINPDSDSFSNKEGLKKSADDLSESQFELLCIAGAENDLQEEQTAELDDLVFNSPEKRKTFDLIRRLRLEPPRVKFRYKYKLRKLTVAQKVIRFSVFGLGAAASLFVAVTLFNRQIPDNSVNNNIASIDSVFTGKITAPEKTIEISKVTYMPNAGLQRIAAAENKSIPPDVPASDSVIVMKPEKVSLSMIDFKKDVSLFSMGSEANLIAHNTQEVIISEEPTSGFNGFVARVFREKISKSDSPVRGNLKAYEIADAGINGLNRLLGWEMSLQKNKDEKGDVKSVYFNSKLLKFNAPVKKVQLLP